MNKNLILAIAATFLLAVAALFIDDGWIYAAAGMATITIVVIMRHFQPWLMKITRWSKNNPRKTQVFITVVQILILGTGLLVGYDLKQLGYQLGDTPAIVFGIFLVSGFLTIPFLPKRNFIALPVTVNRQRMAYLSILLSAYVLMIITGNRIEDKFPNSPVSLALRTIDRAIFTEHINPGNETDLQTESTASRQHALLTNESSSRLGFALLGATSETSLSPAIHPKDKALEKIKPGKKAERMEKRQKKMMKRMEGLRKAFAAGASAGSIFLIIVLIAAVCAGICLIVTGGTAGAVILGILITAGAVFGLIKVAKKKKRAKEEM